jgi:hypothetical protein
MLSRRFNAQDCTFNARGSRIIIVAVQAGAGENICSSGGGAQEEKGKQDET